MHYKKSYYDYSHIDKDICTNFRLEYCYLKMDAEESEDMEDIMKRILAGGIEAGRGHPKFPCVERIQMVNSSSSFRAKSICLHAVKMCHKVLSFLRKISVLF